MEQDGRGCGRGRAGGGIDLGDGSGVIDENAEDGGDEAGGDEGEQGRAEEAGQGERRALVLVLLKRTGEEFHQDPADEEGEEKRGDGQHGGQPPDMNPEAGFDEFRGLLPQAEADPRAGAEDQAA